MTDSGDASPPSPGERWTRERHGVDGVPPCRSCGTAMELTGGRLGLQLWSDTWSCPSCGNELRISFGRGSVG